MRHRLLLVLGLAALAIFVSTCGRRSALSPTRPDVVVRPGVAPRALAAPTASSPADGASVTEPVALSWLPVTDPSGIIAYNWEVSTTSAFTSITLQSSTNGATADTLSGLANGSYFWRVQAVSGAFVQGAWSVPRSFTVTGVAAGTLAPPILGPTQAYTTFHPREVIQFHWSAVTGAITYRLEVSTDSTFAQGTLPPGVVSFFFDNIPNPGFGFQLGDNEGRFFARVFAVAANSPQVGKRSQPSNVIQYTVFYNNPIGPAPVPISPTGGVSLTLPFSLVWHHVPNPQPFGYEVQIAPDAAFSVNEAPFGVQITDSLFQVFSLAAGSHFWRVRSTQGMASPTLNAVTAWSPTQSFALSTAPPTPVSVTALKNPLFSGENTFIQIQLTAAVPAAGATLALTSSNPAAAPVPATLAVPGSAGLVQFQLTAGQVLATTPVTITATLNGVSTTGSLTVLPPSLQSVFVPSLASGGALGGGNVMLNGAAPPGGALVSLTSSSPAASPPASVLVPAGDFSAPFTMPTTDVAVNTPVTLTGTWKGTTVQAQFTLTPRQAPATFTLTPTTVVGQSGSSFGRVTVATPPATDLLLSLASSQPAIASVNNGVVIPAGSIQGGFDVFTQPVSVTTVVNISVSGGGVTLTVPLTVTPVGTPPPPPTGPSSLTLNPTSVAAGGSSVGTVTLFAAAPAGGTIVNLSSGLPLRIIVPATVTVPAGATSATFNVSTTLGPSTSTNISAEVGGVIATAGFLVNDVPPPAPGTPTLLAPANGANVAQPVTLDWSDVAGATSYEVQVDNSSTIAAPFTANPTVGVSQVTLTGLPAQRLFWRVRAANSAGVFGAFSATRKFTPQAAPAAASLNALALSPASVVGGTAVQGSVTLTSAAPSTGAVVALASANPALATVPASVTIAAGATSATFPVSTSPVAASSTVALSGSFAGVTRSATLTLTPVPPPASLSAVSVSPASVTGGSSSAGTVTLTSAAPAGGVVATLASSLPGVASVPASVTIAAGATSAGFTATTTAVTSATSVTLTATLAGVVRTATLAVNPVSATPLAAPSQLSPPVDSRVAPGTLITFDWTDVTGAASYTIQIDDNSSFPAPLLLGQDVTVSQLSTSTLPTTTMWWRVRANSSTGTAGNWSAAQRFEVKL